MYIELIELRELGAARSMLRQTSPMEHMLKEEPHRYKHLEDMLSKPYFEAQEVRRRENEGNCASTTIIARSIPIVPKPAAGASW